MGQYQNIVGKKLGNGVAGTTYSTLYTAPDLTRTYIKDINVCNVTANNHNGYLHIVPSGGSPTISNAIMYNYLVTGHDVHNWRGLAIMNAGDTIQVKADVADCLTFYISGADAT